MDETSEGDISQYQESQSEKQGVLNAAFDHGDHDLKVLLAGRMAKDKAAETYYGSLLATCLDIKPSVLLSGKSQIDILRKNLAHFPGYDIVTYNEGIDALFYKASTLMEIVKQNSEIFGDVTDTESLKKMIQVFSIGNQSDGDDLRLGVLLGFPRTSIDKYISHKDHIQAINDWKAEDTKNTKMYYDMVAKIEWSDAKYRKATARQIDLAAQMWNKILPPHIDGSILAHRVVFDLPGMRFVSYAPDASELQFAEDYRKKWEASHVDSLKRKFFLKSLVS
ncbi:MAG: hypothetical protein WCO78_04865 [Candidatus Roizmanbacteria bacterium]